MCVSFALHCLGGSVARSQQAEPPKDLPAPEAEAKKSAVLHEVFLQEISDYEFYLDVEKQKRLELRGEPVMRFTSAVDRHGELYVWTHQGRAELVGGIFSIPQGERVRLVHEFSSLAQQPLIAGNRGGYRWEPQEAGVTLEPIPDAPQPANTEARRLTQMRELRAAIERTC